MFNDDVPVEDLKYDILGRTRFVKNVTKSLINWDKNEPLVISICGTWGSGKTSVLNMLKQAIKEDKTKKYAYTIINFNPWSYSNKDNILNNFLDEFALKVKGENKNTLYKEIIKYKKRLSFIPDINQMNSIIDNIILITLMSLNNIFINEKNSKIIFFIILFIYITTKIILPIIQIRFSRRFKIKSIEFDLLEKSPTEIKNRISEEINKSNNKYIIIIDDIDRLDKEEIQKLFKMVRNNIDFPNTFFLLAYDRDIVAKSLCVQEGVHGDKYLNKIIQVDFCLPEIQKNLLDQYFLNSFESSLKSLILVTKQLENGKLLKRQDILINGICPFIKNIRDSKRLVNNFEYYLNMSNNEGVLELNPIDLLGLETIRLFEFEYYNFIKDNESLFLGAPIDSYGENKENKETHELFYNSLNKIPINSKMELIQLLKMLFPCIRKTTSLVPYYNDNSDNRELRISNYLFFKSYFNFVPGGNDNIVCEFDFMKLLTLKNSYDSLIKYIEFLKKDNKFDSLISKLQDDSNINDLYDESNLEIIILAFFNSLSYIKSEEYKTHFLQPTIYIKMFNLIYNLFIRTTDSYKNYSIMQNIINRSDSIYYLSYFIAEIESKTDLNEIFTINQLSDLKKHMVKKIDEYSDFLLDDNTINFILLKWKVWGASNKYFKFIEAIKTKDDLFVKFIGHYSLTAESYIFVTSINTIKERYFDYKNIEEHIPLSFIDKKIKKIYILPKYNKYKETFDLFLNNFDKIDKGLKR